MDYSKKALKLHQKFKGKIATKLKVPLKSKEDLSVAYTPGVGAVSLEIAKDKSKSFELTNRANTIAVVSDGTAVLGLGDIGPEAAMPVMEGKAAIFKAFADVDAVPLCIATKDPEEIIKFCKLIEPSFSGINLEDISAPRCFEILDRLKDELSIPVFHDDQEGTAIVVLAALINACRVSQKVMKDLNIVINGAGAAGIAIAELLLAQGVKDVVLVDSKGTICERREGLNETKKKFAQVTNKRQISCDLSGAMAGADVFIGVSKADLVNKAMVKSMAPQPIIFAMANPVPEIMPDEALAAGATIVGTGRSDFPNQINNALVFPGIFRGLLDGRIKTVTQEMKLSAAVALAYALKKPTKDKILPLVTDKAAARAVAAAIAKKGKK